ncbi:NAD(P)H-dependent oxidoreductase subunit E [Catellatospora sp. IY07-71]|uniref:NAD(P)H-dependent oxidoreductase subunit E n=1 Tax=Catellatospora sp. IY07-71 TaxID=2728827 RepID=UPI001FD4631E|nr:NAD(P)H-dependent oxidoreductase subunit E [Catellatospora sp. IY07-71]
MPDGMRPGRSALEELVAREGDTGVLDRLREAAPGGPVVADAVLPTAAAHGTISYFRDLSSPRGARHVRVCAGTACFLAGGGRHVTQVEQALGVTAGTCSADGSTSLQAVHCLGFCYGGPAALDGDTPLAGGDVADQLTGRAPRRAPPIPVRAAAGPVALRGLTATPGWRVWPRLAGQVDAAALILDEINRSGLRGRGGAGFPAARKWQAVGAQPAPRYVVANGDEGDPGSYADRLLMERSPDAVLEGLALAGLACGASRGFVYVRSEYPQALGSIRRAVEQARAAGHLGRAVHGTGIDFDVTVIEGAGSYVAGEETSLLRSMSGLRGSVRLRPPYPAEYGLFGRPTAVNNVETLAAVPRIVDTGGDAYARLGRAPETGTLVVCLNERFTRPGAYEVELGTPLREVVYHLGGGLAAGRHLRALQIGGPLGGFLAPDRLGLPLLASALDAAGVALGHGGIIAVDDSVTAAQLLDHLWRFYASESCGACTPCREGTRRGAADPAAASADTPLLDLMAAASLCPFGRGVPRAVRSLRQALGEDFG